VSGLLREVPPHRHCARCGEALAPDAVATHRCRAPVIVDVLECLCGVDVWVASDGRRFELATSRVHRCAATAPTAPTAPGGARRVQRW
jgi:hypothetical protein